MAGFVRKLLRRLGADGDQTWQGGRGWARKKSGEVRFQGNDLVAMLTRKFSHGQDIGPMVLIFYGEAYSTIAICLQKMNDIYHAV